MEFIQTILLWQNVNATQQIINTLEQQHADSRRMELIRWWGAWADEQFGPTTMVEDDKRSVALYNFDTTETLAVERRKMMEETNEGDLWWAALKDVIPWVLVWLTVGFLMVLVGAFFTFIVLNFIVNDPDWDGWSWVLSAWIFGGLGFGIWRLWHVSKTNAGLFDFKSYDPEAESVLCRMFPPGTKFRTSRGYATSLDYPEYIPGEMKFRVRAADVSTGRGMTLEVGASSQVNSQQITP